VLASSPHWVPGAPERSLSVRELYTSAEPLAQPELSYPAGVFWARQAKRDDEDDT
jgi:hypothetical protein